MISKRQGKLCKSGFIPCPLRQTHPPPRHQTACCAICPRPESSASPASSSSGPLASLRLAFLVSSVRSGFRTMDGRKQQVPSIGLVIQVRTEVLVLDTCQCAKGLVKELVCPRGDAFVQSKKGATATKDVRYATKYLDTTGTLGREGTHK